MEKWKNFNFCLRLRKYIKTLKCTWCSDDRPENSQNNFQRYKQLGISYGEWLLEWDDRNVRATRDWYRWHCHVSCIRTSRCRALHPTVHTDLVKWAKIVYLNANVWLIFYFFLKRTRTSKLIRDKKLFYI